VKPVTDLQDLARTSRRLRSAVVVPRPHPEVFQSEVGGSRVLFNSRDRRLHVLTSKAGAVWDDLGHAGTIGEVAAGLSHLFGAELGLVRLDVERVIDQFRSDGLVTVDGHVGAPLSCRQTRSTSTVAPGTFSIEALDSVVAIDCADDDVMVALAQVLAPLASDEVASETLCVAETAEGTWTIRRNDDDPVTVGSRLAAVLRAVAEVNHLAVASVPDDLVFHAGAVGGRDGVVLLPAASNHGKSTLTASLVGAGFRYLTDEAAAIGSDLMCRPFPKSIALDPGSFALFPDLAPPAGDGLVGALRGREWHVDPSRVGRVGEPGPVRVIVCPHWRAGSATRVSRCAATEALHLLIGEAFDFTAGGQAVFDRLGRLVDTVPVYRLGYSNLSEAVEAVSALLQDPGSLPGMSGS